MPKLVRQNDTYHMAENLYPLYSSGMLGNVIMALLFLTFRRSSFDARTQPVKNAVNDTTIPVKMIVFLQSVFRKLSRKKKLKQFD